MVWWNLAPNWTKITPISRKWHRCSWAWRRNRSFEAHRTLLGSQQNSGTRYGANLGPNWIRFGAGKSYFGATWRAIRRIWHRSTWVWRPNHFFGALRTLLGSQQSSGTRFGANLSAKWDPIWSQVAYGSNLAAQSSIFGPVLEPIGPFGHPFGVHFVTSSKQNMQYAICIILSTCNVALSLLLYFPVFSSIFPLALSFGLGVVCRSSCPISRACLHGLWFFYLWTAFEPCWRGVICRLPTVSDST